MTIDRRWINGGEKINSFNCCHSSPLDVSGRSRRCPKTERTTRRLSGQETQWLVRFGGPVAQGEQRHQWAMRFATFHYQKCSSSPWARITKSANSNFLSQSRWDIPGCSRSPVSYLDGKRNFRYWSFFISAFINLAVRLIDWSIDWLGHWSIDWLRLMCFIAI